jgi:hypothetical protein
MLKMLKEQLPSKYVRGLAMRQSMLTSVLLNVTSHMTVSFKTCCRGRKTSLVTMANKIDIRGHIVVDLLVLVSKNCTDIDLDDIIRRH